jgi:hypothetical protein
LTKNGISVSAAAIGGRSDARQIKVLGAGLYFRIVRAAAGGPQLDSGPPHVGPK